VCFSVFCSDKKESSSSKILARVGDNSISINNIERIYGKYPIDSLLVYNYLSRWVENELLFQGGVSLGLHHDENILQKTSTFNKKMVGNAFLGLNQKEKKIKADAIRNYYKVNKNEFKRQVQEVDIVRFTARDRPLALKIKNRLRKTPINKISDFISKYNGTQEKIRFGGFPPNINQKVFSKDHFKKGNILGPYLVESVYHVIKIESVYKKGSFLGVDIVYDEIYQRLKNLAFALRLREVVDSLKLEFSVTIDSQNIRSLF
jgi:hypothetical protein